MTTHNICLVGCARNINEEIEQIPIKDTPFSNLLPIAHINIHNCFGKVSFFPRKTGEKASQIKKKKEKKKEIERKDTQ